MNSIFTQATLSQIPVFVFCTYYVGNGASHFTACFYCQGCERKNSMENCCNIASRNRAQKLGVILVSSLKCPLIVTSR